MKPIQLDYYRRRLIRMRKVVEQNFLVHPPSSEDEPRGIFSTRRKWSLHNGRSRLELAQLHLELSRALARISKGIFGQCTICQHPIQEARLRLIPYTCKCHACAGQPLPREELRNRLESS
ncbi:MAG: hypothetical protein HUJ26_12275 [Planctomycetaceae bacterium]|nr:hypothetical protein [Planctomycetaceae bacterium]